MNKVVKISCLLGLLLSLNATAIPWYISNPLSGHWPCHHANFKDIPAGTFSFYSESIGGNTYRFSGELAGQYKEEDASLINITIPKATAILSDDNVSVTIDDDIKTGHHFVHTADGVVSVEDTYSATTYYFAGNIKVQTKEVVTEDRLIGGKWVPMKKVINVEVPVAFDCKRIVKKLNRD